MMSIEDNGLFEIFPAIKTISETFEYQNSMLNKIVLTGKINALEIAENLFNFTEQTAKKFTELQSEIVLNLLRENQNELTLKAKTKAQIAIDTLMKNISIRKADIETLTRDFQVRRFFKGEITKHQIKERLEQFVSMYTMYNEVMILDTKGHVKVNINPENKVRFSKDMILQESRKSDDILISLKKTDMFIKQRESLFFIKSFENGYLVVFLNFKDETKRIFDDLITDSEIITFIDKRNNILASSERGLDKSFVKGVKKDDVFVVTNNLFHIKTSSDFDNKLEWSSVVSYKRRKDINIVAEFSSDNITNNHLAQINLNNEELQKLASDGYAILEDLSDVIINGELIAAKSKQYILIPILDNLREVSFKIVKLIELSISSLQEIIDESVTNDAKIMSKFIVDTLIRSMYERCSNVKWWAMCLSDSIESKSVLNQSLKYLNNLYPQNSDIFVYDQTSEIIAISNSQNFVDVKIDHNYTMTNRDINKCFVSDFEITKYDDRMSLVYYASILKDGEVKGGVGAVYNIESDIINLFEKIFSHKKGIGLLVNNHGKVLFTTDSRFEKGFNLVPLEDGFIDDIEFDGKKYKAAVSQSKEYREYKNENLFAIILMEK